MKIVIKTLIVTSMIALSSCSKEQQTFNVIPLPQDVVLEDGTINLSGAGFTVSEEFDMPSKDYIADFATLLSSATGNETKIGKNGKVHFLYDKSIAGEGYQIETKGKKVEVRAADLNGVIYAIETMKQMLPEQIYKGVYAPEEEWSLQRGIIKDQPRFGYRGLMIDVARHFFSMDEMKKIIDVMTIHKLNRLHWHLTDDQGWRIEIKKYPELVKIGSHRDGTCIGRDPKTNDHVPYGGFYTQEQIREIVTYAASKGIEVVPEIDLPGHMLGALATYPELGCTGGPYKVWHRWGVSDDVLCVGQEETFTFLENVLTEVCELFPSEYIHIGGDECPKTRWEKCPRCQARIKALGLKDDEKHTAEHYLQSYVTERIGDFLASKGRKIIGWDEILEGKLPDGATVMSWRGSEGGIAAAESGHDAIMSPYTHFYLDYYQSKDQEKEPLAIGGYLPVEQVYMYEMDMDEESMKHILGIQANMWTEYVGTDDYIEYMILPRLAAVSEVQWCQKGQRDWKRFRNSMNSVRKIYDAMDLNYAKHIFEGEPDPEIIKK